MSRAVDLEFHPLSNLFPLIEGVSFRELVEDIRVHGLRHPIVLHEGEILDGRNRYLAARAAQVNLRFTTYDGKDPLAYVVSQNLRRRHLDASQRAMIAAQLAQEHGHNGAVGCPRKEGRRGAGGRLLRAPKNPNHGNVADVPISPAGPPIRKLPTRMNVPLASKLMNVSTAYVLQAKKVLERGSKPLVEAVKAGELAVHAAKEIATLPKDQQTRIIKSGGGAGVHVIGQQISRARLEDRRIKRAGKGASESAVFDHLKIGDGRAIGTLRMGEVQRLAASLRLLAKVLDRVSQRYANADHSARVRDVIKQSDLSKMISDAKAELEAEVAA